jgi:hypothetical protein
VEEETKESEHIKESKVKIRNQVDTKDQQVVNEFSF